MRSKAYSAKYLLLVMVIVLLSGCAANERKWIYQAGSGGVMKFDVSGKEYYYVSNVDSKEVVVDEGWLYYVSDDGKIKKTKLKCQGRNTV